jgi:hypothetical protein
MGKFVFLNGLVDLTAKSPGGFRGFSRLSVLIIAGGRKLVRHVDIIDLYGDSWVWGLTGFGVIF